jgi:hypothetical protein
VGSRIRSKDITIRMLVLSVTRSSMTLGDKTGARGIDMRSEERRAARADILNRSSTVADTKTDMQSAATRGRMRNQEDQRWVR